MTAPPTAYAIVPAVASTLAFVLAVLAWDRRPARGVTAFSVALLSVAVWSAAYVCELLATDPATSLLWARLSYVGIAAFPVAWLVFSLAYAGYDEWVSRGVVLALAAVPVSVLAITWAPSTSTLFWRDVTTVAHDGGVLLRYEYGPVYWLFTGYAYLLIGAGMVALLGAIRRTPSRGRLALAGLLLAVVPPVVGNVLYLAGEGPVPGVDLTSLGTVIACVVVFALLFRYGFFDPATAAYERVFEQIQDPIFLLDVDHRVREWNPAATALVGGQAASIAGRPLPEVLPGGGDLFRPDDDRVYRDRLVLDVDGEQTAYDVSLSSLYYPQQDVMGRLVILKGRNGSGVDLDGEPTDRADRSRRGVDPRPDADG